MARIQILELPSEVVGDLVQPKFVVVIDGVKPDSDLHRTTAVEWLRNATGAVGVIVSGDTLDIPANN